MPVLHHNLILTNNIYAFQNGFRMITSFTGNSITRGSSSLFRLSLLLLLSFIVLPFEARPEEKKKEESGLKSKLPTFGAGGGFLYFMGDIGYKQYNEPLTSSSAFQLELQHKSNSRTSISAFILSGNVFGEEKSRSRTLNFRSSIVSQGLMVRYDFLNEKKPGQILIPFITGGLEYMFFRAKADHKDAAGNTYYYWDDGSIRSLDQNDPNAQTAVTLYRDYKYETDLRQANIDGFGNYREGSLAMPVGGGLRLKISPKVSLQLSTVMHYVYTDMIDAISENSTGTRAGDSKNDRLLYSSASLRYDFSARKTDGNKYKFTAEDLRNVDFSSIDMEDSDKDGVIDLLDVSPDTPKGVKVDAQGRPLDSDNDGIPDYKDKEPNSAKNAVVNQEGVTITEQMIEEKFRRDSLAAMPAVIEYIDSYERLVKRNPDFEKEQKLQSKSLNNSNKAIPVRFSTIDTDKNGHISPPEIGIAIDQFMAGKSTYTVSEFYNLIDFFFNQ